MSLLKFKPLPWYFKPNWAKDQICKPALTSATRQGSVRNLSLEFLRIFWASNWFLVAKGAYFRRDYGFAVCILCHVNILFKLNYVGRFSNLWTQNCCYVENLKVLQDKAQINGIFLPESSTWRHYCSLLFLSLWWTLIDNFWAAFSVTVLLCVQHRLLIKWSLASVRLFSQWSYLPSQ